MSYWLPSKGYVFHLFPQLTRMTPQWSMVSDKELDSQSPGVYTKFQVYIGNNKDIFQGTEAATQWMRLFAWYAQSPGSNPSMHRTL